MRSLDIADRPDPIYKLYTNVNIVSISHSCALHDGGFLRRKKRRLYIIVNTNAKPWTTAGLPMATLLTLPLRIRGLRNFI
jgi:hypothetical protein